jgi:general secretion pathway protein E
VVVNQRLVRQLCTKCRRRTEPDAKAREWLVEAEADVPAHVWVSDGCEHCGGTGYYGRTGIFEIWRLDETDYELLLANADERTLRDRLTQRAAGGLLGDGLEKVAAGVTDLGEVRQAGCL